MEIDILLFGIKNLHNAEEKEMMDPKINSCDLRESKFGVIFNNN